MLLLPFILLKELRPARDRGPDFHQSSKLISVGGCMRVFSAELGSDFPWGLAFIFRHLNQGQIFKQNSGPKLCPVCGAPPWNRKPDQTQPSQEGPFFCSFDNLKPRLLSGLSPLEAGCISTSRGASRAVIPACMAPRPGPGERLAGQGGPPVPRGFLRLWASYSAPCLSPMAPLLPGRAGSVAHLLICLAFYSMKQGRAGDRAGSIQQDRLPRSLSDPHLLVSSSRLSSLGAGP